MYRSRLIIIVAFCASLIISGAVLVVRKDSFIVSASSISSSSVSHRLPLIATIFSDTLPEVATVESGPKRIAIYLEKQKLYAYEGDVLRYEFVISTGAPGTPTPTGDFFIYNKLTNQLSPLFNIYMDNWMAFTDDGLYGIHSLPYWKLKNGERLYEGQDHLGTKISNGCIRLSVPDSEIVWDWAEVGIPVHIEN